MLLNFLFINIESNNSLHKSTFIRQDILDILLENLIFFSISL